MGKRLVFLGGDIVGSNGVRYVSDIENKGRMRSCLFECPICGCTFSCLLMNVRHNRTLSCGCLASVSATKHGLSSHPIYNVWNNIKHRTSNPNYALYQSYGAKGVGMCSEWFDSVVCFYDWCISNGWDNNLDIDRIDTKGDYKPSNCRFVTREVNSSNRVTSSIWTVFGIEYKTLKLAAEAIGVSSMTVRKRAMLDDYPDYSKKMVY